MSSGESEEFWTRVLVSMETLSTRFIQSSLAELSGAQLMQVNRFKCLLECLRSDRCLFCFFFAHDTFRPPFQRSLPPGHQECRPGSVRAQPSHRAGAELAGGLRAEGRGETYADTNPPTLWGTPVLLPTL